LNPFSKSNGEQASPDDDDALPEAPDSGTGAHPDVVKLHATLDDIEGRRFESAKLSRLVGDRRIVARSRRKDLERRAHKLVPDSGIDPEDTGEFFVEAAVG
jgi:hypothetical protein